MRILVTGGAGFIGSHVTDVLLGRGYAVTSVDDLSRGSVDRVRHHVAHPLYRLHTFDVRNLPQLLSVGAGCDVVVHLAALKIPRYSSAYHTLTVNADGTRAALELANANRAKFVLASTSDIYGKNATLPFSEESDAVLGPSTSRRWAYAASKLFDEHLSYAYQDQYGIRVAILRYFGAYGERQYLDWWGGPQGVFLRALSDGAPLEIHGDGTQTRCFIHVTDLAEATVRAIERPAADGHIVNIGTAEEISILGLATMMHRLAGLPGEPQIHWVPYSDLSTNYEDVRRRVPDLHRMRRLLGIEPSVGLKDGLERLWAWYSADSSLRGRQLASYERREEMPEV
jgi:UDP-glucose 4-epimerase